MNSLVSPAECHVKIKNNLNKRMFFFTIFGTETLTPSKWQGLYIGANTLIVRGAAGKGLVTIKKQLNFFILSSRI